MITKETGAKLMVMDADVPEEGRALRKAVLARTSTAHFTMGTPSRARWREIDGMHLTPGHTKGCTTWTMKVQEGGRTLNAVIIGSPNVNPGYILV